MHCCSILSHWQYILLTWCCFIVLILAPYFMPHNYIYFTSEYPYFIVVRLIHSLFRFTEWHNASALPYSIHIICVYSRIDINLLNRPWFLWCSLMKLLFHSHSHSLSYLALFVCVCDCACVNYARNVFIAYLTRFHCDAMWYSQFSLCFIIPANIF